MNVLTGLLASLGGPQKILSKAADFVGDVLEDVGSGRVKSFSDFGQSLARSGARVLKGPLGQPVKQIEHDVWHKPDGHERFVPSVQEVTLRKNLEQPMEAVKIHNTPAGNPSSQIILKPIRSKRTKKTKKRKRKLSKM